MRKNNQQTQNHLEETMKRLLLVFMCAVFLIPTACSQAAAPVSASGVSSGGSVRPVTFDAQPGASAGSSAAAGDTVTLPASLFVGQNLDDIKADAQKSGVESVVPNKDGSVTYKMSKDAHQQLLIDTRQKTIQALRKFQNCSDFPFIHGLLYSNDFSEITLLVDKSEYDTQKVYDALCDSSLLFEIGSAVSAYQIVGGASAGSVKTTLRYRDRKTNQMFKTALYPMDLKNSGAAVSSAVSSGSVSSAVSVR